MAGPGGTGTWRNLVFAFAWGACAAALIAIVANSFATKWIATATADPAGADTLGATVIAPIVEESAKPRPCCWCSSSADVTSPGSWTAW